jgi:excisionase family DNA binding protein
MEREIMTPDQAAEYLQLNRETIYRYIREGKLVASRLGRSYRIPKRSLDLLMWSTSTIPGFIPREYTKEQIDQFIKDDQLTGKARGIVERVRQAQKGPAITAEDEIEARQHA